MGSEGGLIEIKLIDLDFPIKAVGVQGLENFCVTERVYVLVHYRNWVRVTPFFRIEYSVID